MRTLFTLEIIARLKTLLLKCRFRVQLPKNFSQRSLDPKIQSRPIDHLLLRLAPINHKRLFAKIRKKSILRRSGLKKTLLWPEGIMLLKLKRRRIIEVTRSAIIVKKRATLLGTARNFQKTSVGLGNFCAGNW